MGRMRYIIIGAGAVGGTIGGCLFQGGHDVVLVARGAHLDALRSRGLTLATPLGTDTLDQYERFAEVNARLAATAATSVSGPSA